MIVEMERQLDELRRTVEELSGEMRASPAAGPRAAERPAREAEDEARAGRRGASSATPTRSCRRSAYRPPPWGSA